MDIVRQRRIGVAIIVVALVAFFAWGQVFHVFGGEFRLDVPTVGFFGWILLGVFGAGYGFGGVKAGVRAVLTLVVLMGGAFLVGVLQGNYG